MLRIDVLGFGHPGVACFAADCFVGFFECQAAAGNQQTMVIEGPTTIVVFVALPGLFYRINWRIVLILQAFSGNGRH